MVLSPLYGASCEGIKNEKREFLDFFRGHQKTALLKRRAVCKSDTILITRCASYDDWTSNACGVCGYSS